MITQLVVFQILLILKKKKYRVIAADLSKQKALDADSRAIQQINNMCLEKQIMILGSFMSLNNQKKQY